jgi:DNA helicase-2/ATP-dependent DNA helicase PcrA
MGSDPSPLLTKILEEPKPLSESQQQAVLSNNRYIRVVAGAGAGKTETLTRRIVKLLLVDGIDPSEIVAFTFTEKAAASMKSRIFERLRQLGGDEACARIGEMYIGTIHAYCFRILEDYFGYGGYSTFDANQEMAFLLRIGWNLNLTEGRNHSDKCELFLQTQNVVNAELIPDSKLQKKAPGFYRSFKEYEEQLTRHKRLTFDRMIALAVQNLEKKPEVLTHIRHLIVDEYQDINRAQERLIRLLGGNGSIFVVGDPRQTIYQFRGSDASCFDDFSRLYENVETIPISENRRSSRSIVALANDFSDSFEHEQYAHLDPVRAAEGSVYLGEFPSDDAEAEWIADQIRHYVDSGQCTFGDIGVLMRSVNTSGACFIDVFRRRGIPFVIGGKVGLFRRQEVQAVGKLIAWLADDGFFQKSPWDWKNTIRGDELHDSALRDWHDAVPEFVAPADLAGKLKEWKKNVRAGKFPHFTEMFHTLLVLLGYHALDPQNPEHAVIMANLGRFGMLLTDYETACRLGGRRLHWVSDLGGLCWFMNTYAMSAYEEQSGDDVQGMNAVQIMTVHQAKGLEWPLVFIPAVVDGRFPSRMAGSRKHWLIPREIFDAGRYEGNMDGERKLMYVALTRAKDVLVVSYFTGLHGRRKGMSGFITDGLATNMMEMVSERNELPLHPVTPKGDAEEIESFSAGELITYGKCPYMYRLNVVWGYQPGLDEYLGYGNSLHFCMRVAAEQIKKGISALSAVANAVDHHFFLPFADDSRNRKVKEEAKKKLLKFTRDHEKDLHRIREVESRIEYPVQRATIVGKIDVILHEGEGVEVRDYKTSDAVVSKDEAALQVRLYSRGLALLGEKVAKGSVAYLNESSVDPVPLESRHMEEANRKAQSYIEGIKRRDFQPCKGETCGNCSYIMICGKR